MAETEPLTIITGGSRGIGSHLVRTFLCETDVLNLSRHPAIGADAAHRLHNMCLDLSNIEHIESRLSAWLDTHPRYRVTTLIHNAAVLNKGRLDSIEQELVEESFRVNVYAPLRLTNALIRAERFSTRGARVAYVVSSLGRLMPELSFSGIGVYSMTKAALSKMALIQRREFQLIAPHVTVIRIHPGIVDTTLQEELRADPDMDPEFKTKTKGLPPYREGEWANRKPADNMRTISPMFAADFVSWAVRSEARSDEYDFYHTAEFHKGRHVSP